MKKRLSAILVLVLCALVMPGPAQNRAPEMGTNPNS